MSSLPVPVLRNSPETFTLKEILDSYDPDTFEKATTLFRKPPYQRTLKKPVEWCKALVNSILCGKSIGSIHLSKWVTHFLDEDGQPSSDEYYNMEDGQTRMDACMRFRMGEFDSAWGPFTAPEIAVRFNSYRVATVLIQKAHNRVKDCIYFRALNENFSDLQESTSLTASDRYLSQKACVEHNFEGSSLVNITLELARTQLSEYMKEYCAVRSLDRDTLSKRLAYMIAIVSGSLDPALANLSYYSHVPYLNNTPDDTSWEDKKTEIVATLKQVFRAIRLALEIKPRVKSEHISAYCNLPNYLGPMLTDRSVYPEESTETFKRRWAMCINDCRTAKEDGDKDWLRQNVYKNLADGVIRNCKKEDLESKMIAVRNYYQNLL